MVPIPTAMLIIRCWGTKTAWMAYEYPSHYRGCTCTRRRLVKVTVASGDGHTAAELPGMAFPLVRVCPTA